MTIRGIKASLRRDKAAFQALHGRRRLEFIWDYYRIPIIAAASILALLLLGAVFNIGRGDTAMYVVLVNAGEDVESSVFDELLERSGMELNGKTVHVASNYKLGGEFSEAYDAQTLQVLAALFSIGDLDLFGADEAVFRSYAVKDAFVDLSLFIEKALLERHEADLLRYTNSDGQEIVGGIRLHAGSPLHRAGYYAGDVLLGIPSQAEHLEEAIAAIRQLLTET